MIPPGFVQALVDYSEATGSTRSLETERDALYLRIREGESGALIASTVSGKSFGFTGSITVEEKFTAFSQAIREVNGERVTMTYAKFSQIQR